MDNNETPEEQDPFEDDAEILECGIENPEECEACG